MWNPSERYWTILFKWESHIVCGDGIPLDNFRLTRDNRCITRHYLLAVWARAHVITMILCRINCRRCSGIANIVHKNSNYSSIVWTSNDMANKPHWPHRPHEPHKLCVNMRMRYAIEEASLLSRIEKLNNRATKSSMTQSGQTEVFFLLAN